VKVSDNVFIRKMYFCFVTPRDSRPIAVYAALLKGENGGRNILVDCGVSYNYPDVEQLCSEAGISLSDLSIVINTHCHADHAGCDSVLKEQNPSLKFWAHPLGARLLADKDLHFATRPVPYFHYLMDGNIIVDRMLSGGETIEITGYPVNVIHTPGHSADSISLYLPKERMLIAGDAVINMNEMPFYESVPDMYATLDTLSRLKPQLVLSAFDGLWDMEKDGDLFALAKKRLDLIRNAVDSVLLSDPEASPEAVGEAALSALGIDMPVSPLFLAGIKSHMNTSQSR
jgi:glyoxylase-like metal-dependent hydrolase (beta-lactamase superfamily II)